MQDNLIKWMKVTAVAIATLCGVASAAVAQEKKITFDDHVKPLLTRRCSSCHNADRTEADLDVTNFIALMQGGGSGQVIEAFSPDDSYLVKLVTHEDSPEMPPSGNKIPDAEIKLLKQWVDQGALENASSTAKKKKPKVDLTAVAANPNQRPEQPPLPPRLSLQPQIHTVRKSQVRSIAVNPWSPIVAVAMPRQVFIYDSGTFELKGVVPFEFGNPEVVRFSRNGGLMLMAGGVGGASGKVVLWDVKKGEVVAAVGDELDSVLAADISADHSLVALGGPKKVVRVFSLADGSQRYQIKKHTQWITAIAFSPDGKSLATADRNGGLLISDAATGNENFNLTGHKLAVNALDWRSDGKVLASVSEDKTVRLWSSHNGKQVKSWEAHGNGVADVAFANDGRIFTTGRDRKVKRWKQDGKSDGQFKGLKDVGMAVAWCDETKQIFAGDWRGALLVWKPGKAERIAELDVNPPLIEDRITACSEKLTLAEEVFKMAKEALAIKMEVLQQLKQESIAKTAELADATQNESQLAGELSALALQIGALADEMVPLKKARDAKHAIVGEARQVVQRWQDEADFASTMASQD